MLNKAQNRKKYFFHSSNETFIEELILDLTGYIYAMHSSDATHRY